MSNNPNRPPLEFTDCENCGKRVATTATLCRHCDTQRKPRQQDLRRSQPRSTSSDAFENDGVEDDDTLSAAEDQALEYGGYDNHDMHDEDQDSKRPLSNLWWIVTIILLCLTVLSIFLPLAFAP